MILEPGFLLEKLLSRLFGAESIEEACKGLVFDEDLLAGGPVGVHLFAVTAKSELRYAGGFGDSAFPSLDPISIWSEHVLSMALRSGTPAVLSRIEGFFGEMHLIPLNRGDKPVGLIAVEYSERVPASQNSFVIEGLARIGAYLIDWHHLKIEKVRAEVTPGSILELTSRQLAILRLIDQGLKNSEIAVQMVVSESTIRQETIKIYRILGVSGRQEAILKGKHLGLTRNN